MEQFESVDDILDFAIKQEEIAYYFYSGLSGKVKKSGVDKLFAGIAKEELGHKEKLIKIKEGGLCSFSPEDIEDMEISEYIPDVLELDADLSHQEAMLIAISKEKGELHLYSDLLNKVEGEELLEILNLIIREEKKHKLRLESEYYDNISPEN